MAPEPCCLQAARSHSLLPPHAATALTAKGPGAASLLWSTATRRRSGPALPARSVFVGLVGLWAELNCSEWVGLLPRHPIPQLGGHCCLALPEIRSGSLAP